MELRQLRYFVRTVELGSFSQAAASLGVVTSALSQQVSRLEGELSTRLLQRSSTGVRPTDAGLAFWRQAQLALRHADDAARAAQLARLSGHVSLGLAPSTATVLAVPLMQQMRERFPDVRLRVVESLSGDLAQMLGARQLDLAVVFRDDSGGRFSVTPLLNERLYLMGRSTLPGMPTGRSVRLAALDTLPLLLPSASHQLRMLVDASFARARCRPQVAAEVDGLAVLMDAVAAGLGATLQPGAAAARLPREGIRVIPVADAQARRPNWLATLPADELSPAAIATRVTLLEVARRLLDAGAWTGARLATV
jgi:LysR family tcuABC transcriptional regulator